MLPLSGRPIPHPEVAAALESYCRVLDWFGSGGRGSVHLAKQVRVGRRKVAAAGWGPPAASGYTVTGNVLGVPAYMSDRLEERWRRWAASAES
jgi:hypothetical protein